MKISLLDSLLKLSKMQVAEHARATARAPRNLGSFGPVQNPKNGEDCARILTTE